MDMNLKKLKEDHPSIMDGQESLGPNGSESSEKKEMTKGEKEAMEKAFQIPSVVEQIIEGLQDLSDLKACRGISSDWKETTTKVMLQKNSAFIVLRLDYGTQRYKKFIHWRLSHYYDSKNLDRMVEDEQDVEDSDDWTTLKEIVDKSTQFPCSTFVIYGGILSYLKDVFKLIGDSIKNLELVRVQFAVPLVLNCPNLETLYTEDCVIGWSPGDISVELPKLKMLHMKNISVDGNSPFQIFSTLTAHNLQIIRGFHLCRDFEAVTEAEKIHCVKELNFEVGDPDDLTTLEELVQAGPQLKLETLNFGLCDSFDKLDYDENSKWMSLIQKLLDFSKITLTFFSFSGIENVLTNLSFQQLPQLREIKIVTWASVRQGAGGRDPYEILSDDISPNLQVINAFNYYYDTQHIVSAGKSHCIKHRNLGLGRHNRSPLLSWREALSIRPQLQLDSLSFYELPSLETINLKWERGKLEKLIGLVKQLLELSKDTLKSFQFQGVGAVLVDMTFPTLSKLKYLNVTADRVRIFPRGINLSETFPTLEILGLHELSGEDSDQIIVIDDDDEWDSYFPPPDAFTGCLTSVKTLILSPGFADSLRKKMRVICPNAKVVYIY